MIEEFSPKPPVLPILEIGDDRFDKVGSAQGGLANARLFAKSTKLPQEHHVDPAMGAPDSLR
jgi:hypothetical protein